MLIEWVIQFGPIALFFLAFELTGKNFFAATTALLAATVLAVVAHFLRSRGIALFPIFSAAFTLLFGGATLYFRNPQFLMVKDTLYDGIFGVALFSSLAAQKNLLRAFFDPLVAMSDRGWRILATRWTIFFFVAAAMNEVVRQNYSDGVWVHYKLANTAVFLVFGFYQFTLIKRERLPGCSNGLGMRVKHPIIPSA